MPSLEALQRAFATAIVAARPTAAAAHIIDDAPGATGRLNIYQNHFRITLIEALAATFPVVKRLVGDAFFAFAVRRFIAGEPPREPRLFAYGGGFPAFLAALPQASGLVYLGDVARLEWALNAAFFADDAVPLAAADLTTLPASTLADCRFPLHPACALIRSDYPIDRIWRTNQDGAEPDASVDLRAGGVTLLVHRDGDDVGWLALDAAAFGFIEALGAGRSLREAAGTVIDDHPAFDPTPLLALLIDAGALLPPPTGS